MIHGNRMLATIQRDPAMSAAWYLMAGYAYEVLDAPIITDEEWDQLCRFVKDNWDAAQKHPHGHLIDPEALDSATAGYLKEDYLPSLTKSAALRLSRAYSPPKGKKNRP